MKAKGILCAVAMVAAFAVGWWCRGAGGVTKPETAEPVPGGEEPPVHLRDGWPPPLAAAWFREPEMSNPLGDIAAQVEAAKELEDARWPSPKADNSSAVAAAGWAVLLRQFRAFGPAIADKAGSDAEADAVRREWNLAEALFREIDGRSHEGLAGSAQGMFDSDEKSRIAWHFLRARMLPGAQSQRWTGIGNAAGEWLGIPFVLTNGFCCIRRPPDRETDGAGNAPGKDGPATWYVFADPASIRPFTGSGTVSVELSFVPGAPCGVESDNGWRGRFRLDGGRLVSEVPKP